MPRCQFNKALALAYAVRDTAPVRAQAGARAPGTDTRGHQAHTYAAFLAALGRGDRSKLTIYNRLKEVLADEPRLLAMLAPFRPTPRRIS
jgi:hypothetical protein